MRFVYVVRCADNSLYTGVTTDLERRIKEHNTSTKGAKYTSARRPVNCVRSISCASRSEASKREYQLKQMTKQEKEKLIVDL